MGAHLNPGNDAFRRTASSATFVGKTQIVKLASSHIDE